MNISQPFIQRPVATTLLLIGLTLAGAAAYTALPVSPLPQVAPHHQCVRQSAPVRVPRPWPPPWRRRWSASSYRRRH